MGGDDFVPDATLIVDAGGVIEEANDVAADLLGYDLDALVGMGVDELVPPGLRSAHAAHRRSFVEGPTRRPMGARLDLSAQRADGSLVRVDIGLDAVGGSRHRRTLVVIREADEHIRRGPGRGDAVVTRALVGPESAGIALLHVHEEHEEIVAVNDELCELLGRDRDELLGRSLAGVFEEDADSTPDSAIGELFRGGRAGGVLERRVRQRGGSVVTLALRSTSLRQTVSGLVLLHVEDVTDQLQREETARELARLLSSSQVGWWRLELPFEPVPAPSSGEVHGGFRPDDPLGLLRQLTVSEAEAARAAIDDAVERGSTLDLVLRIRTPPGQSDRWYRMIGRRVRGDAEPPALVGLTVDVTDVHAAPQSLSVQDEVRRVMLETVSSLVVVLDRDGRIEELNEACRVTAGLPLTSLIGERVWDVLVPADARDEVRTVFKELVSTGRPGRFENDWLTASGERRRISWANAAVVGEGGEVTHVIGTGTDVTELRALERQLAQAQKVDALGRLAAGIAHDFNNVLAVIQGHVEALSSGVDATEASRRLEIVRQAVARSSTLVGELMSIGRQRPEDRQEVDLCQLLEQLAASLATLLGADITLNIESSCTEPGLVALSPARLESLLLNLASNARDAMPGGGAFSLRCRSMSSPSPAVLLEASDTGTGMDTSTRAQALEPFFTTKHHRTGAGLGLASVTATVQQAGGTIDVDSEPGWGTTVRIALPTVEPELRPDELTRDVSEHGTHPVLGVTVLVVEDDVDVLELMVELLRNAGYSALEALSPAEAVDVVTAGHRIDVVVTDVVMPGRSGPELVGDLRRHVPDLRAVYVSGYSELTHAAAERVGDDPLLRKPFTAAELLKQVGRAASTVPRPE